MKSTTDPHRDGHERFRVTKKNLEDKLPNPSILNELQEWNTTLADGLDDLDEWYPDTKI
jgi:hypothetical protein